MPNKKSLGEKTRAGTVPGKAASGISEPNGIPGNSRLWEGTVPPGIEGEIRVDRYVAEMAGVLSRSQQKARGALIRVNGKEVKPSRTVKSSDRVELAWTEEASEGIVPEDIALSVLYEDNRVIVIDKAQGMVTHPGNGNRRGTLANALLGRLATGAAEHPAPESFRGGIVHRLDKDTSGVIIAAKDAEAQAFLASQFKDRLARKEYVAVVRGQPVPAHGRIENRLGRDPRERKRFTAVAEGGKVAVTDYRVLAFYGPYALVSLRPRTGRTHQLRVHLAGLGTPILGDPIYGKRDPGYPAATLMLHAYRLKIMLPGGLEASLFKASLPPRFTALVSDLERRYGKAVPEGN